jgi:prephenate dehydrogenase
MNKKKKLIAIIGGAGKMGQWLAEFLKNDGHEVVIADRDRDALKTAGRRLGVKTVASNAAAARGADYILLAVPLENLEATVEEISRQVQEWQAVIDITSVKVEPVKIMHRRLKNSTILGAHPLFGPGAWSIANKNFVLTPTW